MTRLYCLLAKSAPKPDEIAVLLAKGAMPASLDGAEFLTPFPSRFECRERLGALVDRELGDLRRREERRRPSRNRNGLGRSLALPESCTVIQVYWIGL